MTTIFEYGEIVRIWKHSHRFRNDNKCPKSDLQLPSKLFLIFVQRFKSPSQQEHGKAIWSDIIGSFLPLFFNLVLPLILLSSMHWSLRVDWFLVSNNVQLKRLDNYRSVCFSSNIVWSFYVWFYPLSISYSFIHLSINLFCYFTKISWIPVIVSAQGTKSRKLVPKVKGSD